MWGAALVARSGVGGTAMAGRGASTGRKRGSSLGGGCKYVPGTCGIGSDARISQ